MCSLASAVGGCFGVGFVNPFQLGISGRMRSNELRVHNARIGKCALDVGPQDENEDEIERNEDGGDDELVLDDGNDHLKGHAVDDKNDLRPRLLGEGGRKGRTMGTAR